MIEDPLVAALDRNLPITAGVLDRAISYHQAQADLHLANVAALKKAHRLYREGLPPLVSQTEVREERDPPLDLRQKRGYVPR